MLIFVQRNKTVKIPNKILKCNFGNLSKFVYQNLICSKGCILTNSLKIPNSIIYSVTMTNVHVCAGNQADCGMIHVRE